MVTSELLIKRKSGEVLLQAQPARKPAEIQTGNVLLDVERCLIDLQRMDPVPAEGNGRGAWSYPAWCSLVGRVVRSNPGEASVALGQRVGAIGPVGPSISLPVVECLTLPVAMDEGEIVYWPLVVALLRIFRRLEFELGESVLVIGAGLTGVLGAQIAHGLGAGRAAVLHPGPGEEAVDPAFREPELPLRIYAGVEALGAETTPASFDVLLDAWGAPDLLKSALPFLRDGGRAMLAGHAAGGPADFDLYRDVHRRSLTLIAGSLQAAVRDGGAGELPRDERIVGELMRRDRLRLPALTSVAFSPVDPLERAVAAPPGSGLIVEWSRVVD